MLESPVTTVILLTMLAIVAPLVLRSLRDFKEPTPIPKSKDKSMR